VRTEGGSTHYGAGMGTVIQVTEEAGMRTCGVQVTEEVGM
jgi:hypothetical protein